MTSECISHESNRYLDALLNQALYTLTGRVLHALNNHLSGMYGMAQLAQATGKPDHALKTASMALDGCQRSKKLISAMSGYISGISSVTAACKPDEICTVVLDLMENDLKKYNIQVLMQIQEGGVVQASSADVSRLVYLLLSDSLKAMPNGGTINIELVVLSNDLCLTITDSEKRELQTSLPSEAELGLRSLSDVFEEYRSAVAILLAQRCGGLLEYHFSDTNTSALVNFKTH